MPTVTLQPDATSGIDTFIRQDTPTNNNGTNQFLNLGERPSIDDSARRVLIKFDLSSIPEYAVIYSATLSLYMLADDASVASTIEVYRSKRAWVENQATWNIYSTGNNWSEAGGFGSDDCEQVAIGSLALTASETVNEFKDIPLTPVTKEALDLGNGWLLKTANELSDLYAYSSSDNATAANRPKLTITYQEPYTVSVDVKDTLEADGTLAALATGGIYDFEETERLGINRTTTPNVFDSSGIIKPTILVKSRSGVPDGNLADDASQHRTLREIIELWFYEDDGYTNIDSMRRRAYTILHATQPNNSFVAYWQQDIRNQRDEDLDATLERSDFTVHTQRSIQ